MANAFLIESPNAIVAIDTLTLVSEAAEMRRYAQELAKPLLSVFVTHAHPDHYNGITTLLADLDEVPVVSTQSVSQSIAEVSDAKDVKWRPHFGDDWPNKIHLPTHIVSDTSTLTFDGTPYSVHELGPGESANDLSIIVGNKTPVVFVGDVVFNKVHSFMNDGHSALWLDSLDRLSHDLRDVELLFTGHGQPGAPLPLIAAQKDYILTYRRELKKLLADETTRTDMQFKEVFEERLSTLFPGYHMTGFIAAGASAVTKELMSAKTDPEVL